MEMIAVLLMPYCSLSNWNGLDLCGDIFSFIVNSLLNVVPQLSPFQRRITMIATIVCKLMSIRTRSLLNDRND